MSELTIAAILLWLLVQLLDHTGPVAATILAVLAARVMVVAVMGQWTAGGRLDAPPRERAVSVWSGLRGAVALALALALGLARDTPARSFLIAMAFGVVLWTRVIHGLTLPLRIRRLGRARGDAAAIPTD